MKLGAHSRERLQDAIDALPDALPDGIHDAVNALPDELDLAPNEKYKFVIEVNKILKNQAKFTDENTRITNDNPAYLRSQGAADPAFLAALLSVGHFTANMNKRQFKAFAQELKCIMKEQDTVKQAHLIKTLMKPMVNTLRALENRQRAHHTRIENTQRVHHTRIENTQRVHHTRIENTRRVQWTTGVSLCAHVGAALAIPIMASPLVASMGAVGSVLHIVAFVGNFGGFVSTHTSFGR